MSSERYELRDMEIYEARIRGASLDSLAEKHGVTAARISDICREVRRTIPQRSRDELIAASLDQLEFLREKVIELAQKEGAPVTAGQNGDIVYDNDGSVVRDYKLRIAAIREARALNETFSKRLGLDAPSESVVKATVQYEVVGLDPEALT